MAKALMLPPVIWGATLTIWSVMKSTVLAMRSFRAGPVPR
jgi:hypothetical protein